MENFIVSARKYRPATFRTVIGQRALTDTLRKVVITQKIAHAYLFCGPRGVGKTTCARIFAKTINCSDLTPEGEACNRCESCVAFNEQRSMNIHELDAASNNGVDDIRELIEQVRFLPQIGRYKVYIIDEVHMLTTSAFNAFLKTLEEPPAHAVFILATTEKHKIIPTVLSRCQIYDFNRIGINDTIEHLRYVAESEGIQAESQALAMIAGKADGAMRDALSIFDQVASFTGGNITYEATIENLNILDYQYYIRLVDHALRNEVVDTLLIFNEVLNKGFDGQNFITGFAAHIRNLFVAKDARSAQLLEVGEGVAEQFHQQATRCANTFLFRALDLANDCDYNYRLSRNKRLLVELTLIKICQITLPPSTGNQAPLPSAQPNVTANIASSGATPYLATPQNNAAPNSQQNPPQPISAPSLSVSAPPKPKEALHSVADQLAQKVEKPAIPTVKGMPGLSLKSLGKQQQEEAEKSLERIDENQPFNLEQLNDAWREYMATIPTKHNLVNAMKQSFPVMTSQTSFEVACYNAMLVEEMQKESVDLLNFIRKRLKNGTVTMNIRETEQTEVRHVFTEREQLEAMIHENPSIADMIRIFNLKIS